MPQSSHWPQNPEYRTPYSQQWNLTVQRQILDDLSFEIAYVGNSNKKQVGYTAINAPLTPGPGPVQPRRLLPNFGDLDGGANRFGSNYNSLQTSLTKRFSRGLQFNVNYTWGKALDDQSSLAEWKTQDPFNMRADYSRASIDLRHDEWGIDVTLSGSQKGLMLPPGLSFNAISNKALEASRRARLRRRRPRRSRFHSARRAPSASVRRIERHRSAT